jgi:hypothetical protein
VSGGPVSGGTVSGGPASSGTVSGGPVSEPLGYDDLVTAATVGTDRSSGSRGAQAPASLAGPAGAHAAVLDDADPAAALLDAAALLTSARRAGLQTAAAGLPPPAPPDAAPELSAGACAVLGYALRERDLLLLADLLTAAAGAGFRAAAPTLPSLLDAAARDSGLCPAVGAVLGERGRWLAAHRPEWQRAAAAARPLRPGQLTGLAGAGPARAPGDGEPGQLDAGALAQTAIWQVGCRAERRDWLAALRQRAPGPAREVLAAAWSRETGDDRAELLQVLAAGLSPDDEPFLESALDDRKGVVRQVAAALLAALPESAFARRAIDRGAGALRVERRELAVTLPEPGDTAAARDGIATAPPVAAIGAGAWRLTQFIAAVPLAEWTTRLGLAPEALAALPVTGGFRADVHAGWRLAAVARQDADWAAALLAADGEDPPDRPPAAWPRSVQLAAVLPAPRRLAWASELLATRGPSRESVAALAACPGSWPASVADAVLAHFAAAAAARATRADRDAMLLAPVAARKLPAEGARDYAAELRALAMSGTIDDGLADKLRRAAAVVGRRRYFLRELH